jgi:hypothetical protein
MFCFHSPLERFTLLSLLCLAGNALEEELHVGELSLSSIDRDLVRDNDNDTNSVCSSLSAGFPASQTVSQGTLMVLLLLLLFFMLLPSQSCHRNC